MDTASTSAVVTQVRGPDTNFALIAKRTYGFDGASWLASGDQLTLRGLEHYQDSVGQGARPALANDSDILSGSKEGTDLIVQGSAFSDRLTRQSRIELEVVTDAGSHRHEIFVTGERKAFKRHDDSLSFSEPEPFTEIPLRFDRAYGGIDLWKQRSEVELLFQKQWVQWTGEDSEELTTFVYHRNPVGRGFVIGDNLTKDFETPLPNFESPSARLTPENLLLGSAERWASAPMPACFDWVDHHWFPRVAFAGMGTGLGLQDQLPECVSGHLPRDLAGANREVIKHQPHIGRIAHGAVTPLVFPTWCGTERLRIRGMHPTKPDVEITLPTERPEMVLEVRKGDHKELVSPKPELRTVIVRPAQSQLVLIWACRHPTGSILPAELIETPKYAVQWKER